MKSTREPSAYFVGKGIGVLDASVSLYDQIVYSWPVADPERGPGAMPPSGPVKISHKTDGHRGRLHRIHVSRPAYPAPGSATAGIPYCVAIIGFDDWLAMGL